ncbi:modifier of mdg4 isoform X10 [Bradysia coprophila]|uniref:modifier of mdg4 isoform X10 n=1 Tax=Bradysia coprophila TaxID=38358 RepID=UPI00187DAD1B|nr:modifier of mdg4 isoform X10 [Bradysia coprophila]
MADEEQFSLCWNNFNSNLSAGFHESLCRGDLVDVTLAAEGQLVKAHRLVLSVCSPYFRKMFTQMPANQHAFVFLKDVSHAALKDLIQFMYCGEVNVKQDALPTFISTAEALQIKGLTETGEPATPASSQTPVKVSTPAPSVASTTATTSPRSRVQRNISRTSYKLESEDSSDDKPAPVVAQKRLISRSITPVTAPALKRTKNSDPLEASEPTSQQQIITTIETKSNAEETEFIDLPMETMPTKSEPDYGDDTGEVEAVDQDTTYVEDDSGDYGDMKYDSSYFTENDDVKAGASGFAEPYAETGDQSANEAQARRSMRRIVLPNKKPLHQTIKSTPRKLEQTIFVQPKAENDDKQLFINPENVIKSLDNGHALVMLKRTRVKGFCVECIKKSGDPAYKKTMTKIITYCPLCPGGNWICATCFDIVHNVEEYLLP